MDFQTILAFGVVAACAAFLIRHWIRQWTGKGHACGGCGGHCGDAKSN
ncbi:MAG: hypothetical protein AMXMBFR84_09230 [Candidatus Hydrogenedentota bacterium]